MSDGRLADFIFCCLRKKRLLMVENLVTRMFIKVLFILAENWKAHNFLETYFMPYIEKEALFSKSYVDI